MVSFVSLLESFSLVRELLLSPPFLRASLFCFFVFVLLALNENSTASIKTERRVVCWGEEESERGKGKQWLLRCATWKSLEKESSRKQKGMDDTCDFSLQPLFRSLLCVTERIMRAWLFVALAALFVAAVPQAGELCECVCVCVCE